MTKKRTLSLLFIFLLVTFSGHPAFSQTFSFSLLTGKNSSSLLDLKNFTKTYAASFNYYQIPVSTFDNFPSYYFIDPHFAWHFSKNSRLGLHFLYTSTGSRVQYSDYSGEVKLDQVIELYAPGVAWEYLSASGRHFELWIIIGGNYLYTKYELTNLFRIEKEIDFTKQIYTSNGVALEPGLQLNYLHKIFIFSLRIDYRLTHSGNLTTQKNGQKEYLYYHDYPIKAQWDGWLWGIGIGFRLRPRTGDAL